MKLHLSAFIFLSIIFPAYESLFIETKCSVGKKVVANTLATICLVQVYPSWAQIPMTEDYYFGSGSKITKRQISTASNYQFDLADASLQGYVAKIKPKLLELKSEANKEQWDDLLRDVKELKRLRSKYFGMSSLNQLAEFNRITVGNADRLESLRESMAFDLGQLSDIAISSRVVFFNTEDLKQVSFLRDEAGTAAQESDETTNVLNSIFDSFKEMTNVLSD